MKVIPLKPVAATAAAATAVPADATGADAPHVWRWSRLFTAPHRLGFAAGALIMGSSALWWAIALAARAASINMTWAVPPAIAHSVLMCFGFMPLFFLGFLFTAAPKWLGQPAVDPGTLVRPITLTVVGWLIYVPSVHIHAWGAAACVALVAVSWCGTTLRFVRLVRSSRAPDRVHAKLVMIACAVGALAMWGVVIGLASSQYTMIRICVMVGLWGFVAMVYVSVAHRMIPFFTANVVPMLNTWRPMWLLGVFVGALLLELVFAVLELVVWPLPAGLRVVQVVLEVPMSLGLLALAVKWGLMQSLRVRLLAMLHVGFVWLGVTMTLQATSHVFMLFSDGGMSLGLAPTHALTMGFMGATLMAMATRVSAGHSGRSLVADDFVWALFWVQQAATVLRLVAAVWVDMAMPLTVIAATLWAASSVIWAVRYGLWYGRPRFDGRPD